MNTEELKKYALAAKLRPDLQVEQVVYRAAANPTAILALIEQHEAVNSELLATRDDNHSMMLEIHNLRIERDKLLAALREIAAWVERYTAANPAAILALIAEIARFTQDAEMAAASLSLLTGHHEHLLAEFDRVTKDRDELLAAWKEYQNADFGVSCQRGVFGKCMCARCTNDRASAVFARAEG